MPRTDEHKESSARGRDEQEVQIKPMALSSAVFPQLENDHNEATLFHTVA